MPLLSKVKRRLGVGARFSGQRYEKQDLRSMTAQGSEWVECEFRGCKMGLGDFVGSRFIGCIFIDCQMDMTNFSNCMVTSCAFSGCSLEQAAFARADIISTKFVDCRMAYSSFLGATGRKHLSFTSCNLHGADLDVLECDRGLPEFYDSNLWGVKVAIGCQVFNGHFDLKTAQRFTAMINRMHPDSRLASFAGEQAEVVERLMGGTDVE